MERGQVWGFDSLWGRDVIVDLEAEQTLERATALRRRHGAAARTAYIGLWRDRKEGRGGTR